MVRSIASLLVLTAIVVAALGCQGSDDGAGEPTTSAPGNQPGGEAAQKPGSGTPVGGEPSGGEQPDAPPVPPPTILTSETIEVGGETRSFVLAKPRTYSSSTSYPLVFVLHGDGGDGSSMRSGFPFDDVSAGDAIVVYPSGTYGWNLYDPADTNPDLAFLVALAKSLEQRFSIDASRIFGTGFSSGGFMVNQVACRRPGFFRAIAPQSGGAPAEPRDATASTWAGGYTRCASQTLGDGPAVMVIHGTADADVVPESGEYTAKYWAYVNGCGTDRSPTAPSPCEQQVSCPTGKPVVYCPIQNLGHAFWSAARTAAWQFFKTF